MREGAIHGEASKKQHRNSQSVIFMEACIQRNFCKAENCQVYWNTNDQKRQKSQGRTIDGLRDIHAHCAINCRYPNRFGGQCVFGKNLTLIS